MRELDAFQNAEGMQIAAQRELVEQLHGDRLQVDLVAFITASGGGLTSGELADLSRHRKFLLDARLHSASGRSFTSREAQDAPVRGDHVYLFAHETLYAIAERELARDLGPYKKRIHEWADQYRSEGWPQNTPQYLLRPYGRFLASAGDIGRLAVIATDPARHDRMLTRTHGDAAALGEIATARRLFCDQVVPDLTALALLALRETRLAYRNEGIPDRLPKVWALLGEKERGIAIARSIADPKERAKALSGLVTGLVSADPETARQLAGEVVQAVRAIPDPDDRVRDICEMLERPTEIDRDLAARLASEAEQAFNANDQSYWRYSLVERLASIGDWDRAERVAVSPERGSQQDRDSALGRLIGLLADAGEWNRAEQVARAYPDPEKRAMGMIKLAKTLIGPDLGEAVRLAGEAAQEADAIDNSWAIGETLPPLVEVLADTGQWDHATDVAHQSADPEIWAEALSGLVSRLQKEDPARGKRLAAEAEDIAFKIGYLPSRVTALSRLAFGLAEIDPGRAMRLAAEAEATLQSFGDLRDRLWWIRSVVAGLARLDPARAGHLAGATAQDARTVLGPESLAWALTELVKGLAAAGPGWVGYVADQAEMAARAIPDREKQRRALDSLVDGLADARDWERAAQIALATTEGRRGETLQRLTKQLADACEWDRAERVACAAQPALDADGYGHEPAELRELVRRLADAREWDRAERAANAINALNWQEWALRDVIDRLVSAGEWDRAERISKAIARPRQRAWDLGAVAEGLADAGDWDRAVRTAQSIPLESELRAWMLTGLAARLASIDADRAILVADEAAQAARAVTIPRWRAHELSGVAEALVNVDYGRARKAAEEAEHAARTRVHGWKWTRLLHGLAMELARTEEWDRAEQTAQAISDAESRAGVLRSLMEQLAQIDPDRARSLADKAETAIGDIDNPARQARVMSGLVEWLAATSEWERAERAAHRVSDAKERTSILTRLAVSLAKVNIDQAVRLADAAKEAALAITDLSVRAEALTGLAQSVASADPVPAGHLADAAEQAALAIADLPARAEALRSLAQSLATADPDPAGHVADAAERAALAINDLPARAEALSGLAESLATADPERAERVAQLARSSADASGRAQVLAKVLRRQIGWLAQVEPVRARPLVDDAMSAAHAIASPQRRTEELHGLLENLTGLKVDHYPATQNAAVVGRFAGEAVQAACAIPDQPDRQRVLCWLVTILAMAARWGDAEEAVRAITDPQAKLRELTSLIGRLAGVQPDPIRQALGEPAPVSPISPAETDRVRKLAGEPKRTARAITGDGPVAMPVPSQYLAGFRQVRDVSPDYFTKEQLVALHPDFLFAGWDYGLQQGTSLTPAGLAQFGIKTLVLTESCARVEKGTTSVNINDTYQDLRNLGEIFNVRTKAQKVIGSMQAQVAAAHTKIAGLKPVTVFDYDSGQAAPFTGAGLATPTALITLGGGTNIFAGLKQSFTSVSWEQVIKADPQCIIINDYGTPTAAQKEKFLETSPITRNLTAVKNRCFLPLAYDEITPGPRNAPAVVAIARWLHSGAFGLPADGS